LFVSAPILGHPYGSFLDNNHVIKSLDLFMSICYPRCCTVRPLGALWRLGYPPSSWRLVDYPRQRRPDYATHYTIWETGKCNRYFTILHHTTLRHPLHYTVAGVGASPIR
jgi:hypothetical protein